MLYTVYMLYNKHGQLIRSWWTTRWRDSHPAMQQLGIQ